MGPMPSAHDLPTRPSLRSTLRDPAAQAALEEHGYAVVPFLGPAELDQLRSALDALGPAPDDPQMALYFGFHSKELGHKRAVSSAVRPIVASACATTFDDHVVYLAMVITKWPGRNSGFGPHQDPTLVDERSFRGVTIWAPLVPTGRDAHGVDNGMLHVVPGSHELVAGARTRNIDESVFVEHRPSILRHGLGVPTQPGEAIVFDNRLIHYSMPNATPTPRPVVSLGMRPAEARCVLPKPDADGMIDLYEVPDDSWIEMVASAVDRWEPPFPPLAKVAPASDAPTVAEFDDWCEHRGEAPWTVPPTPAARDAADVEVDPFCSFCGATDDLVHDRATRGRAQLQCRTCDAEVRRIDAAPTWPSPPLTATATAPRWRTALRRVAARVR